MRALLIDQAARERIQKVKAFASQRRLSMHDIMRHMRQNLAPGDDENYRAEFFDGFKVVFTVEEQPEPIGWVFHFSISVTPKNAPKNTKKPFPHEAAVDVLLKEFGLPPFKQAAKMWIEEIQDAPNALNFLFPLNE